MTSIYVVRHAQVKVEPEVASHLWELSEEGRDAAEELARGESWEDVAWIYHSPEPKAEATARVIAEVAGGMELRMHPDLRELEMRTGYLSAAEFQGRLQQYLVGAEDPDFEPFEEAAARIERCVREIVEEAAGRSVAIVSHGRILTALYSRLLGRRLTIEEWRSIRMPDVSVIDTETWQVKRGFLSI